MASGLTPIYLIPYPLSSDPVNVHGDLYSLALQIENVFATKANLNSNNSFNGINVFNATSSSDAVRIVQNGTGNAFVVEDSTSPDSTPFIIDTSGNVAIGKTTASVKLDVVGAGAFTGTVTGSTFNALTLTAAATGFTIAGGTTSKTLTVNNTLSFSGTDSTVMTFPSTSQTLVGLTSSQVLTNKSLSDSTTYIVDATDNTKRLQFDITGTTAVTGIFQTGFTTAKTVTFQDVAGTVYVSSGTDVTLADGGTNASLTASNGGIVYSTATAMAILAGTATAGQHLQSGASGAPSWTTAVYPSTTTANQILYSSAANNITGLATANNQVLVTNASGIPAFSGTLPSGVTASSLTSFGTSPTLTTPTIDTINVSGAAVAAALWNTTLTTGSISMGGALTTGGINIANGTAFNGTISLASGAGTVNKTINIGTSSTSGTTAIAIGSASGATSTVTLNGSTSVVGTLTTSGNVTVGGDLTVNGILTSINTNTLTVDDKNLELGAVAAVTVSTTGTVGSITGTGPWTATITGMTDTADLIVGSAITATNGTGSLGAGGTYIVASIVSQTSITYTATGGTTPVAGTVTNITTTGATDTTANGGGITLLGTTNKTITWDGTNWTSNQPWNITSGNTFKVNNVSVLSGTSVLGITPTANATGFSIAGGTTSKSLTIQNNITLSGTDGVTINLGSTNGTLGSAAFTASTAYEPAITTLAATKGGTGTGTYTTGDILYASATNTLSKLSATTNGYVLTLVGGVPAWTIAPSSGFTNPMTTLGDTIYGGASGTATRLAGPAINGIYFLRENVTASASVAPDWIGSTGSGNVVLATSPTISTPVVDTINISAAGTSGALWNTTITTGSISIGGSLTSGNVNIATGTTYTGTINIASGITTAGTKTLNLGTTGGAGSTTTINIGSTTGTSTTTVLGTFKIGNTIVAQGVTGTITLPATAGTLALNPTTTIGDIIYASATGTPGTLARLAGNIATQPSFLTSTGNGTANTTTSFTTSTGSGSVVLGTSPTITTPQLSLETTSRTTEGSMSWDATNDYLRIGNATVAKSFFPFDVNTTAKTGAYTLVLSDQNTLIQMNGAFAFTVPLNSTVPYPIGTQIHLLALTTGVSVTFTGGITSYATPGTKLRAAGSMATLIKLNTDTWVLTGDLIA